MSFIRPNVLSAAAYTPGEQPTDSVTIKLNTNENAYPPSPRVMDAIRAITPEQLRKYPSPSARPFAEAAAQIHNLSPDFILPFNGGDELLATLFRATCGESNSVAYLEPSYSLYPVLATMQGCTQIPLQYEISAPAPQLPITNYQLPNPQWSLPKNIAATPASLLLIVNPNAPSATLEPLATLDAIAATFPGLLVIDEAYVDFAPHSALPLVSKYPNVLILRSMSKGYGLAGLRFGYAIAQPALLQQLYKVRDSYPCDVISIAAATAAIQDQPYARSTWQKTIAERTRLATALRQLGFTLPDPHSNFLLATVPPAASAQSLYEGLKSRHILVRYFNLPRLTDKLRITIGTPDQNDRLISELASML